MSFSEYITNESQKQHLNLTDYAWNIIDRDIFTFCTEQKNPTISFYLNRILENYYEESPANLTSLYKKSEKKYAALLSEYPEDTMTAQIKNHLIRKLCHTDIEQTVSNLLVYPKGRGHKFRLNNENYERITHLNDTTLESRIFKKPGNYLKAFFESYCRLPYIERERIFFLKTILEIENALLRQCSLSVTLTNNLRFSVKPYKIETDRHHNFNYLIGLCCPYPFETDLENTIPSSEPHCASFRISRIVSAQCRYRNPSSLSSEEISDMESEIKKKGVPFLLNDISETAVRLTDEGVRKYNSMLHLRPPYTNKTSDNIYFFHVSEMQIEFYFFKFGKDAEILSPESLRNKFHMEYSEACSVYDKSQP